jgi:hypothetical protein
MVGVGGWFISLSLTYALLSVFGPTSDIGNVFEHAVWIVVEGIGVGLKTPLSESLLTTDTYLLVDSNIVVPQIILHFLLPAVTLMFGGYLLASRHSSQDAPSTIVGGASAAIWFTMAMVLSIPLVGGDGVSIEYLELIIIGGLYAGVFATIGATVKSTVPLRSLSATGLGIATFISSFAFWYLLSDPFENYAGVSGFGDFTTGFQRFAFLNQFIETHTAGAGEMLPGWYVVLVPMLVSSVWVYHSNTSSMLKGAGNSSRLALGYVIPTIVLLVGLGVTAVQSFESQSSGSGWSDALIREATIILGEIPRIAIMAGVVYPVIFAAVGGVIGASVVKIMKGKRIEKRQKKEQETGGKKAPYGTGDGVLSSQKEEKAKAYQRKKRRQGGSKTNTKGNRGNNKGR